VWNHCALAVDGGHVVEAREGYGVVETDLSEFLDRYPYIAVLRPNAARPCDIARECAIARSLLGTPYRKIMPIFRLQGVIPGQNCTSLMRLLHYAAFGVEPGWLLPDNIYRDRRYCLVELKQ
jgi:hypothetical protein